jgi:hypothetical protein
MKKAIPLNVDHERDYIISFNVPDAWQICRITVYKDSPREITPKWLEENPNLWDFDIYADERESGGDAMEDIVIEQEVT